MIENLVRSILGEDLVSWVDVVVERGRHDDEVVRVTVYYDDIVASPKTNDILDLPIKLRAQIESEWGVEGYPVVRYIAASDAGRAHAAE